MEPVRAWPNEGAALSAGSDYPAAGYDAMRSIWGLVTRGTEAAGVLGPDQAIDQYNRLLSLQPLLGARLGGEDHLRGTLAPRRLADLVAFHTDPSPARWTGSYRCARPSHWLAAALVFDPERRLG